MREMGLDPEIAAEGSPSARWRLARRSAVPLGIACCVAIAVTRCPQLLAAPRFWAEEGRDYFAYAFAHGPLAGLLASHLGYYALVTNAGAALASHVPLEHAPMVKTAIALLVLTTASALWDLDRCRGATDRVVVFRRVEMNETGAIVLARKSSP